MQNKTSLVINILLILFGVGMVIFGISGLQSNSTNWPSIQATVTKVKTSSETKSSSDNSYETEYKVDVWFEYTVNGNTYKSNLTETYSYESSAQESAAQHQPGTEITRYYDPKDPNNSVSTPGEAEWMGFLGLVIGVAFMGIGGWSIFKALRTGNQTQETSIFQE